MPRITALISSIFPSRYAPAFYNYTALLVSMWSAMTIASSRHRCAWLLALLLMAVPHWWGEILGTITNVQWIMAPALATIIATATPVSALARRNQLVFGLVAGLTGPFSMFSLPLCVARVWADRDVHSKQLVGIVLLTALVQLVTALNNFVNSTGDSAPIAEAITILDRWFGQLATGHLTHSFSQVKALGLVLLAYTLALACVRDRLNLSLLVFSGVMMAATWLKYLHGYPNYFARGWYADRYFYTPRLTVTFTLACALISVRRSLSVRLVAAAALGLIITNAHDSRRTPLKRLPWIEGADKLDAGLPVEIPTNPEGLWTVRVNPLASKTE